MADRAKRRTWYGLLAVDNAEEVRARIGRMLTGRPYTFVTHNVELRLTAPDVRTSQRLTEPPRLAAPGHIICVATDQTWGISSPYETEVDARQAIRRGTRDIVHVLIEGDGTGRRDRIEIQQYNMMSPPELLHWVIVPEHPEWAAEGGATGG